MGLIDLMTSAIRVSVPHVFAGLRSALSWPVAKLAAADEWVCDVLKQNIRPLVSAGLIFGTVLGAVVLTAFFTVQIGEHSQYQMSTCVVKRQLQLISA